MYRLWAEVWGRYTFIGNSVSFEICPLPLDLALACDSMSREDQSVSVTRHRYFSQGRTFDMDVVTHDRLSRFSASLSPSRSDTARRERSERDRFSPVTEAAEGRGWGASADFCTARVSASPTDGSLTSGLPLLNPALTRSGRADGQVA